MGQDTDGPPANSKAIERGNRLESLVLEYPCDAIAGLSMTGAPWRVHPEHPALGDSADALYLDGAGAPLYVGEGKTVSAGVAGEYGAEGTDEIPHHTLLQAHWHLMHWPEVGTCLVPVLVGGHRFEFRLYRVGRNADFAATLMAEALDWHAKHVVTGRPPPPEAGDTERLKGILQDVQPGKWVEDSEELKGLVALKVEAAQARKAATEAEERAKNRIKSLLGDAEGCKADWGSVYFRRSKGRTRTDWAAIARERGATDEDIARHTSVGIGARTLRVYLPGGNNEDG
jgi:hypothetical protein